MCRSRVRFVYVYLYLCVGPCLCHCVLLNEVNMHAVDVVYIIFCFPPEGSSLASKEEKPNSNALGITITIAMLTRILYLLLILAQQKFNGFR